VDRLREERSFLEAVQRLSEEERLEVFVLHEEDQPGAEHLVVVVQVDLEMAN
jgi:hypothetical protein